MYFGLVISTKKKTKRKDGTYIAFSKNSVLTLAENLKFIGTRVYYPICKEIRNTKKLDLKNKKIISYSNITI